MVKYYFVHKFRFKLLHHDKTTRARAGEIHTPHGMIETPAFVPVGTQATVKSLTPDELASLGVELFFVNTYHAYLRPGLEVIQKFGGLHQFMNWQRPLITDSGGVQVFSLGRKKISKDVHNAPQALALALRGGVDEIPPLRLRGGQEELRKGATEEVVLASKFSGDERSMGKLVKIDEDGVTFTSHWDGSVHRFTPEFSMQLQHQLGADIHIAFDECTPYPTTHEYALKAMNRTHRWAKRSLEEHKKLWLSCHSGNPDKSGKKSIADASNSDKLRDPSTSLGMTKSYQALYGVVQGSIFKDLREQSADFISNLDFDGIAIGGVSVGESKQEMREVCQWVVPRLPEDKARHLLGVGEIDDIFVATENGMDTFDCVQPTRLARMGHLLVNYPISNKYQLSNNPIKKFQLDINKTQFSKDILPIDPKCVCYTCRNFSRAYIHHLFRVRELLAYRLATIHNLHFVLELVKNIRSSITDGTYLQFKEKFFKI